jgi:hypothetical protein
MSLDKSQQPTAALISSLDRIQDRLTPEENERRMAARWDFVCFGYLSNDWMVRLRKMYSQASKRKLSATAD